MTLLLTKCIFNAIQAGEGLFLMLWADGLFAWMWRGELDYQLLWRQLAADRLIPAERRQSQPHMAAPTSRRGQQSIYAGFDKSSSIIHLNDQRQPYGPAAHHGRIDT